MDYNQDWAYDDVLVKRLVRFASQLEKKHEGEQVISLGQSFSWPVYTLGRIRERSGKPADNGYIPFSGSIFRFNEFRYDMDLLTRELTGSMNGSKPSILKKISNILKGRPTNFTHKASDQEFEKRYYFKYSEAKLPSAYNLVKYFNHLNMKGLGVKSLVDHHQKTGQRTAILEKACMGDGFYSFLSLWVAEAQSRGLEEEIKDAAYFMVYSLNAGLLRPESTYLEHSSAPAYPIEIIEPKKKKEIDLIQSFSRDNSLDENSSRLVDMFNIGAKAQGNDLCMEKADNAEKIAFIKGKIERFIDREIG